jgi:hypothetical protein
MADEIDMELHTSRIGDRGTKVTYRAAPDSLPDGCFVRLEENAYLIWEDSLLLWTPEGYSRREIPLRDLIVEVLTPEPFVECFRQGYKPQIHGSRHSL